jgi:phage shock protein C
MDKKLKRSRDQFIAGVCGGFAEYLGWDVTLVRILYVILSLGSFGFPGLMFYIICWLVMPVADETNNI